MPQIYDMDRRLYFPSEGRRAEDFFALKMYSTGYYYQILMKLEFSQPIFRKNYEISNFTKISRGGRIVPCGQTDRNDGANDCCSQLCELAKKKKNK